MLDKLRPSDLDVLGGDAAGGITCLYPAVTAVRQMQGDAHLFAIVTKRSKASEHQRVLRRSTCCRPSWRHSSAAVVALKQQRYTFMTR